MDVHKEEILIPVRVDSALVCPLVADLLNPTGMQSRQRKMQILPMCRLKASIPPSFIGCILEVWREAPSVTLYCMTEDTLTHCEYF